MSSTPSPALTDGDGALAALVEVAEQSFFAFTEPHEAGTPREDVADSLQASMAFTSDDCTGSVALVVPVALARELTAAFAGCDQDDVTGVMLADATGELCNMIGGLWLTRSSPQRIFQLHQPVVSAIAGSPDDGRWGWVRVNGMLMGLRTARDPR